MRKLLVATAALSLLLFAVPGWAANPSATDETFSGVPGGGGGTRTNDCPGFILWDTGMYDNFTPPTGCASAASSQCFVNAENAGGFPADGRRLADDFIADGRSISHIKTWGRFNQAGYDYYISNPSSLHGFCVKFYKPRDDQQPIWCPDGTVPGETAIGDIVYSEYVSVFTPFELPAPALARSFNYCMTLPVPFQPVAGQAYWVSVSADFDFTANGTQWFWRLYQGFYEPYCEASWWDTWGTEVPWNAVSVGVAQPCWAGWNASFVLYSQQEFPTGACCAPDGTCTVTSEQDCPPPGIWMAGLACDPNPCQGTPVKNSTWGQIKNQYR